jgi:transmembrane protein EpsG
MIIVIILNVLAVVFAYLVRYRQLRFGLKISFFLIYLFLALRYGFGNDYFNYLRVFYDINSYSITYITGDLFTEPGWLFLCHLFDSLGFFAMTAVLAIFNCLVFYRFIKKYVPPGYYWFAVFLYVFNPGFMLIHSSAMRQSVAINLFVYSIDFLYKKDAIRYFLCIALATLFHASALILFPVYFLGLFNWKINKITAIVIFSLIVSLFWLGKSVMPFLEQIIGTYFGKYGIYRGGEELKTGLGLLINMAIFLIMLFYLQNQKKEISLLFKLAIISYFCIPISMVLSMIARIDLYFQIALIAAFPILIISMKKQVLKIALTVLLMFMTLYSFYIFFHSDIWIESFGTYNTIFSAPQIY